MRIIPARRAATRAEAQSVSARTTGSVGIDKTGPCRRAAHSVPARTTRIREEGRRYVDKTRFAHRLVDEGKHFFLSRPRRFGKSCMRTRAGGWWCWWTTFDAGSIFTYA